MARARRGPGVTGRYDSTTAYFWDRTGWGGRLAGACVRVVVREHHESKPKGPDKPKAPDKPTGSDKPPKP
jgi:hypothetical protein